MKGGLMQHDDEGEEGEKVEYPICLMSNPFFVGKKKKKKKKGKKGRWWYSLSLSYKRNISKRET